MGSGPQPQRPSPCLAVNLGRAHCRPHPVSLSAFLSLSSRPGRPAGPALGRSLPGGRSESSGKSPLSCVGGSKVWGAQGLSLGGVELSAQVVTTTKAPAAEHFHTRFLTSPTTSLEGERVGGMVMPYAANQGARRQ